MQVLNRSEDGGGGEEKGYGMVVAGGGGWWLRVGLSPEKGMRFEKDLFANTYY